MAEGLAAAGVTRVSMGAQSFDDRVLAALGRVHDADRVAAAVATLRAAGVAALNLDLIYGGPGEDAGSWSATLEAASPSGPSTCPPTPSPSSRPPSSAAWSPPAGWPSRARTTSPTATTPPARSSPPPATTTTRSPTGPGTARRGWERARARPGDGHPHPVPCQPAQPDLLAAGAVPRPGSGGARVRRGDPPLERQRGARLPGGGPGAPAADLRARSGWTPARPASRPWRCGCGRPTGSTRARPGAWGLDPAEQGRRAPTGRPAGPRAWAEADREGHVPARRGGRPAGLALAYLDCYAAEHGSSCAGRGGHGPR